ncbi:sigma-70 family RNA polymerase sigma factor [Chloroflexota bacterium]
MSQVLYLNPSHKAARKATDACVQRGAVDRRHKEAMLTSCFNQYYDKIARYIYARLGDGAESEDLASEVFLKAYKSLDSFKERGIPMQAWLYKIAHNLLVDHQRKRSKMKVVHSETKLEIADDNDPMNAAFINVEYARVVESLNRLTQEQRQVIELRFFGGLTSEEVGKLMDKTSGAVRQMQSHAIKRLRLLLEKH